MGNRPDTGNRRVRGAATISTSTRIVACSRRLAKRLVLVPLHRGWPVPLPVHWLLVWLARRWRHA
jgi:hypothetical protein